MKGKDLTFQYFLGDESEQFSFIRVPKTFFMDKRFEPLSYGAKILYGLLLDRISLSRKNGWYDGQHRAYVIYTIDSIREDFSVSKTVAVKFMKELEDFGLIEKKRRPNAAALIYVKNFILPEETESVETPDNSGSPYCELPEVRDLEVQKMDFQNNAEISGSPKSGLPEYKLPEVQKMESNKTNKNKTNKMISSSVPRSETDAEDVEKMVKEKIHYSGIVNAGNDSRLVDAMVKSLVELFRTSRQKLKINSQTLQVHQVKEKIWDSLSERSFCLILENIRNNEVEAVYNMQNYLVACFYNLFLLEYKGQNPGKRQSDGFDFEQNRYDFKVLENRLLEVSAGEGG